MDAVFLDIKDIDGDSDIKGFEKKIEILSFNHGISLPVTGDVSNENRTSGRPNIQDLALTKFVDKATVKLNQKCVEGANLGEVTLTIGRNDKGTILPFLVYKLKDVIISSINISGGGDGKPIENFTLNFSEINWTYTVQKQEGGKEGEVKAGWSVAKNEAS